jgi:hypothetical protein
MSAKGSDVKLRMSRSFGDFYLKQNASLGSDKQAVIAVPEVKVVQRGERDAFCVLACDGIFDVMTNQEVVDFVAQQIGFDGEPCWICIFITINTHFVFTAHGHPHHAITTNVAAEVCDALLAECLARGTVDNLSVVLVIFASSMPSSVHNSSLTPGSVSSSSNPYQYYHSNTQQSGGSQSQGHVAVQRRLSGTHSSEALLHHHVHSISPQHMLSQHSNAQHGLALRSPRDYSVDMPINSGSGHHTLSNSLLSSSGGISSIQNSAHSLNTRALNNTSNPHLTSPPRGLLNSSLSGVFHHVEAAGDSSQGVSSPLNTAAGSSRVRKQLQFHDS